MDKPVKMRVHELLGVGKDGHIIYDSPTFGRHEYDLDPDGTVRRWRGGIEVGSSILAEMLEHPEYILRRPTLTDEQREVLLWLHKGGYLWVCHDVPDDTLYAFASLPTRLGNDNGAWVNTDNGAGMAYGVRIECLRPLLPDWTVPLDVEKTLRDAGVEG